MNLRTASEDSGSVASHKKTTVLARGTAYKSLEQPLPEQESYLETLCSHGHCRQGRKEDTEQLQCWGRSGEEEKKEGRGERGRDRSKVVVWTRAGLEEGATGCLTGRLDFWCLSKRRRLKGKERHLISPDRTMIDTIQGDDKICLEMSTARSYSFPPSWDKFHRGPALSSGFFRGRHHEGPLTTCPAIQCPLGISMGCSCAVVDRPVLHGSHRVRPREVVQDLANEKFPPAWDCSRWCP